MYKKTLACNHPVRILLLLKHKSERRGQKINISFNINMRDTLVSTETDNFLKSRAVDK